LNSIAERLSEVFEKLGLFQVFQVSGTEGARSLKVCSSSLIGKTLAIQRFLEAAITESVSWNPESQEGKTPTQK
jgi:hypothetical protein